MTNPKHARRARQMMLFGLGLLFPLPQVLADQVAVSNHTAIIRQDGTLVLSGTNQYGQLGMVDHFPRLMFCPPQATGVWKNAWVGPTSTVAQKEDGSLQAFGQTVHEMGNDTDWSEISLGERHGIGRKNNGTLWVWGNGSSGQLGLGSSSNADVPVQLAADSNWLEFDAGNLYNLAIKADGSLWAWGYDFYGQLGVGGTGFGTAYRRTSPVRVGASNDWMKVSAGNSHSLAIRSDGSLWAWGNAGFGKLGTGNATSSSIPVQVGGGTDWLAVSAGSDHSLALKADGSLWAWGKNTSGQLGLGDTVDRSFPVRVDDANDWISIEAGQSHSAAIRRGGVVWLWGENDYGQLGTAEAGDRLVPAEASFANAPDISVIIHPHPTHSGQFVQSGAGDLVLPQTTQGTLTSSDITIYNHGSSPLGISDVRMGSGFGTGDTPPFSIAPGNSIKLSVILDGSVSGALSSNFEILSNDPDEPVFRIGLTGRVFSFKEDFDGDGLSDAAELRMAAMGFQWDVPNPALLAVLRSQGYRAGLVTEAELRDEQPDAFLFKRDEGKGTAAVCLRMEKSADLSRFIRTGIFGASVDTGGRLLVPQPHDQTKSFYRFAIDPSSDVP